MTGAMLLDDALDLAELVHQAGLVLQAAGGVDEHRVDARGRRRCLTASKATLAGSPPSGPRTTSTPTRSPHVASWSTAAARNVSAAPRVTEQVLGDQDPGDLADGGGLAGAVDADDEDDAGLAVGARDLEPAIHVGADELDQLLAQHGAGVVRLAALDPEPGAQPLDERLGGCDADVGGQQGVLDGLPGVLVEPVAAQEGEQALAEAALRARESLAQPHQSRRRTLRFLQRRRRRDLGLDLDAPAPAAPRSRRRSRSASRR